VVIHVARDEISPIPEPKRVGAPHDKGHKGGKNALFPPAGDARSLGSTQALTVHVRCPALGSKRHDGANGAKGLGGATPCCAVSLCALLPCCYHACGEYRDSAGYHRHDPTEKESELPRVPQGRCQAQEESGSKLHGQR